METDFINHETFLCNKSSEPILELEPLSNDENLVINDIFDNCIENEFGKESNESTNKYFTSQKLCSPYYNENADQLETENPPCVECEEKPELKSEMLMVSTSLVDNNESSAIPIDVEKVNVIQELLCTSRNVFSVNDVPDLIKEKKINLDDPKDEVECLSINYSGTKVVNLVDSDTDSDNDNTLQIDMSLSLETKEKMKLPVVYQTLKAYHCVNCKENFTWQQNFLQHINREHSVILVTCPCCHNKIHKSQLVSHLIDHLRGKVNVDNVNTLSKVKNLVSTRSTSHIQEAVSINKCVWIYSCGVCDLTFLRISALIDHTHGHLNIFLKCEICEETFVSKVFLKKHMVCHKKYSCKQCDLVFKSGRMLQYHLSFHLASPIVCEICGKEFYMKFMFTKHTYNHGTYACTKCDKKFFTQRKLNAHMNSHTKEKNYCGECKTGFKKLRDLKQHWKNNHQEGSNSKSDYECMKCKKMFNTMVEYSLHSHAM